MKFSFNRITFSSKGFIGPIGDDLPSLVPIVIALLLFFSIFAMTLSTYVAKNDELQKQTTMTSVARELKGDSLVLGIDQFKSKCRGLAVKRFPYSFMAGIYSTDVDLSVVINDFANASDPSGGESYVNSEESYLLKQKLEGGDTLAFYCNYDSIGGQEFTKIKKNYLLRFYPISVQYQIPSPSGELQYLIVPAVMAMVFWE